ncbi:MAG: NusG domain II-containing protein [Deltaproteobacteria bacterium]|nr:NusG domain II-containing protein [Deltaproteobacteria bacterium]
MGRSRIIATAIYNESQDDASRIKNFLSVIQPQTGGFLEKAVVSISTDQRSSAMYSVISKMKKNNYATPGDWALGVSLLVFSVILFFVLPGWVGSTGMLVEIHRGERAFGRYDLEVDRVVQVPGPLGITQVEIKENRARVTRSPCPQKYCLRMGSVDRNGGLVVCVPNEVIVHMGKERPDGLDAVSQ